MLLLLVIPRANPKDIYLCRCKLCREVWEMIFCEVYMRESVHDVTDGFEVDAIGSPLRSLKCEYVHTLHLYLCYSGRIRT